jgi:ATP adenylyltransferase
MEYILNGKQVEGCAFCNEMAKEDGPGNLIVSRGQRAFLILNRYPYTSGHLMVVPKEHIADLDGLDTTTRAEIMEITAKAIRVLRLVYHPDGFNIGLNMGEAAGAGITEHVHLHIVPRWGGDTNFMTAIGTTRVLPESLDDTYVRVSKAWAIV